MNNQTKPPTLLQRIQGLLAENKFDEAVKIHNAAVNYHLSGDEAAQDEVVPMLDILKCSKLLKDYHKERN